MDHQTYAGMSALRLACRGGHYEAVQALLEGGSSPTQRDARGETAFDVTTRDDILALLRDAPKLRALCMARKDLLMRCRQGNLDHLIKYASLGGDVNIKIGGVTPLMAAAAASQLAVVEALLELGARPRMTNKLQRSALYLASECKASTEVLQALIAAGSNVNEAARYGLTSLHAAASAGATKVLSVLIKDGGADRALRANNKDMAIHLACNAQHWSCVQVLVTDDTKEAKGSEGLNALHIACKVGSRKGVGIMLDVGSDIEATTEASHTPLQIAAVNAHLEIVNILLSRGAVATRRAVSTCRQPQIRQILLAIVIEREEKEEHEREEKKREEAARERNGLPPMPKSRSRPTSKLRRARP
ncbi:unnamed protein product [Chrysoparadoxa australica]